MLVWLLTMLCIDHSAMMMKVFVPYCQSILRRIRSEVLHTICRISVARVFHMKHTKKLHYTTPHSALTTLSSEDHSYEEWSGMLRSLGVAVDTHGDFIVLPHWEISQSANTII